MALDTGRRRLESLERRAGGRALWGKTWSSCTSPLRTRGRRRGGFGIGSGLGLLLVAGLFVTFWYREPLGVAPIVDHWSARLRGTFGYACSDLDRRYASAVSSLGGPLEAGNRRALSSAIAGCRAEAPTFGDRGRACLSASGSFEHAFARRQSLLMAAAAQVPENGVVGASAAGVLGSDDIAAEEAIARSLLTDCRG